MLFSSKRKGASEEDNAAAAAVEATASMALAMFVVFAAIRLAPWFIKSLRRSA
jgi:hypothetical protein